jgi:Cobalamin-independent synthase, Catalytic domain
VTRPWPPGAVTGIGSLPGTDPTDAVALVFGELPDLPHLPELPDRGAGADMVGRTAALLVDLPVELVPSGWQIAAHPGRDLRRAEDLLARDLDALEGGAAGYAGALKLQATGPLTLAAAVELRTGHKIVTDPGALRDLTESLAEGLAAHLADVGSRLPAARLVLQLDEPSLPTVLAGHVRTPSGYGTVRAIDPQAAEQALRTVLEVAPDGARAVHSCARDTPIALLHAAGANAIGVDASLLGTKDYDALGEAVEGGVGLWLGVLPSTDADITLDGARRPIRRLWSELGFDPELLASTVVATPTCGLAGASPTYVRRVLGVLRDVGRDSLDPS